MGGHFDLPKLENRIKELELIINKEDFWNDFDNANKVNSEYVRLSKKVKNYKDLLDEVNTLELLENELEPEEFASEFQKLESKVSELELSTHFRGEYDALNCYLEIHPGAGGTESCDWASMLLRMYNRFCERNNFILETISENKGEEAGIKSVTVLIKGDNAYGYLKRENGIHRLVRISPFDANKRRHTSFASVSVTPEFLETPNVEIKETDLKIDVYHSSGAGGQSVNTSNSAVRITHMPTKTVVTCQNERSQLKNKEVAMKILKNKLYELELQEIAKKKNEVKEDSCNIDFGSQIRNYVLEPYKLVKDLRSGYESNSPDKILDGEIFAMLEYNLKNIGQ